MIIIPASVKIENQPLNAYQTIEKIGRTCYKSEDKITNDSAERFVRMLRDRGHTAMFDHVSVSVRFIVDRGVSHELVRHRIAAYAQESTRYCNYEKMDNITFIDPCFLNKEGSTLDKLRWFTWEAAMKNAEWSYIELIRHGASPQEARSVLPNSLKTEIVATLDFTAWRHVFKLRTAKAAHPQMREIMIPLLNIFKMYWPACFDDIKED